MLDVLSHMRSRIRANAMSKRLKKPRNPAAKTPDFTDLRRWNSLRQDPAVHATSVIQSIILRGPSSSGKCWNNCRLFPLLSGAGEVSEALQIQQRNLRPVE